ncbi:helix-turn-helix domain-containing protein [Alkalihalobacillus sp. MEB130]|uniref:sugar diacid recognition domain-containing protein n=1 Tax=Alkalihalobacillus sp. MEB130 TaxID=2976704 RepID=UPI0028DE78C5|nr:sugar diacid recognition domain-containing protein [Alkalihalobacillus sp. MEB130]MDT8862418.1 helix-turn-helix domain-containing protein [Alkalihalobacillus sp. MEB130]
MILKQIAQKLSDDTSKIIGYPVSIADEHGYLIGVNDQSRIGIFDDLLSIVIKNKKLMYWTEKDSRKYTNLFPGVAAPIIVNGEVIGALGIIGKIKEDSETENYIRLVRNHIEMMCYEEIRKEVKSFEASSIDKLIHYILHFDNSKQDTDYIIRYSKMLGFDLTFNRVCFIIELKTTLNIDDGHCQQSNIQQFQYDLLEIISDLFKDDQEDMIGSLNFEQYCILKTVYLNEIDDSFLRKLEEKTKKLNTLLEERYNVSAFVAIGGLHNNNGIIGVIRSYQDALKTLDAGKKINNNNHFFNSKNQTILLEMLLNELPTNSFKKIHETYSSFLKHDSFDVLSQTFLMYCKCNMNISETARELFIHRNSLIYRLEKIKKLANLDISNFEHCLLLYMMIKNYQT